MSEIRTVPPPVADNALAILEECAARVRSGEVQAVAVAEVYRDGKVGATWSGCERSAMLGGAIARLAHRFNLARDDQ